MSYLKDGAVIGIVGLGYVGLPLALGLARRFTVIGLDADARKIAEMEDKMPASITATADATALKQADVVIICVPTPVRKDKEPDLSLVEGAARTVGKNLKPGATVVLESTVYPGVTEEILKPALERESGLVCGQDFKIGYSPERINPGDAEHTVETITKVVAGMDAATTELMAELYGALTPHIHRAPTIRTAEAAKVIENIQRDLNIALMNELSIIFEKMGLDITAVLEAAGTKWNFHRYSPGLVGGHCIPVDPYYLVHKARQLGYEPQVILAGRAINDGMPARVAEMAVQALEDTGKQVAGARVLVMGLTYKENVADTRESPSQRIIEKLEARGIEVIAYDPLLAGEPAGHELNVPLLADLEGLKKDPVQAVIVAVAHTAFTSLGPDLLEAVQDGRPVLIDIRRMLSESDRDRFYYRTL